MSEIEGSARFDLGNGISLTIKTGAAMAPDDQDLEDALQAMFREENSPGPRNPIPFGQGGTVSIERPGSMSARFALTVATNALFRKLRSKPRPVAGQGEKP